MEGVMVAPDKPLLQEYVMAPLAVKEALVPTQAEPLFAIEIIGTE